MVSGPVVGTLQATMELLVTCELETTYPILCDCSSCGWDLTCYAVLTGITKWKHQVKTMVCSQPAALRGTLAFPFSLFFPCLPDTVLFCTVRKTLLASGSSFEMLGCFSLQPLHNTDTTMLPETAVSSSRCRHHCPPNPY